jgi:hypothetical protein
MKLIATHSIIEKIEFMTRDASNIMYVVQINPRETTHVCFHLKIGAYLSIKVVETMTSICIKRSEYFIASLSFHI